MSKVRGIIFIQPPFVQLNSPYPAPYYLKSFLEARFPETNFPGQKKLPVTILDHSIGLFEKIFSRPGLEQIFSDAAGRQGRRNKKNAEIIERFISEKTLWLASIDRLIAFLRGRDPEWGHFLTLANGCIPGGPRADNFIATRRGEILPDEAKILATKLLADLADFITCALDQSFSLIRYTPIMEASLNTGLRDFAAVQRCLRGGPAAGYIINSFYRPMLGEEWDKLEKAESGFSCSGGGAEDSSGDPFLLGLTIPFPGCLSGALAAAESAKKRFGSGVRTVAGGGYVNTELRFLNTPDFFDYFDYVSFDRGYGSLLSILKHIEDPGSSPDADIMIYKTMYRPRGAVIPPGIASDSIAPETPAVLEDAAARTVFPDYSSVDFSRYLYPVDDVNPMHRLWTDGHWLKAYLAHGCYWHSCAFCDVSLDYIRNFVPVDPAALFTHLKIQAEKTGVRGIHLVDEAAPVSSLLEFALLNREAGLPLNFWGNIRYERNFTPGIAAILAAGGLIGVSAGLEVATERGFQRLGKGINLESAVRACAAFKEAGILTHAYLIYGYWDEDEQEIVDSAEILRQLFAQRLLDSAFWHKFVLTRHSRIYAEKQRGLHASLIVKDDPDGDQKTGALFALNDLSFEGEEQFDKYTEPLEKLLGAWMRGETDYPVTEAFPFRVKEPSVPPDLVDDLLGNYTGDQIAEKETVPGRKKALPIETDKNVLFLGSAPWLYQEKGNFFLRWRWQLEEKEYWADSRKEAEGLSVLLETASRGKGLPFQEFFSSLEKITGENGVRTSWIQLREYGLAVYPAPQA